jgi:hypothetical protein
MKKIILFGIALGMIISQGQAQSTYRIYLRGGVTLSPPTMEELDFPPSWETFMKRDLSVTNIGVGSQFLFPVKSSKVGVDIGFSSLFNNHVTENVGNDHDTEFTDSEGTFYILAIAEKAFPGGIFVQGGIGPHIVTWKSEYSYTDFDYPELNTDDYYSGTDIYVGMNLGFGYDLNLDKRMGLFIMGRMDAILDGEYGVVVPLSLSVGLRL